MTADALQLRIVGCIWLQTRVCCRNYGWPVAHDCTRVCTAATTDGQVHMTADTRVLPQLRMTSTRVLPQLRLAGCT